MSLLKDLGWCPVNWGVWRKLFLVSRLLSRKSGVPGNRSLVNQSQTVSHYNRYLILSLIADNIFKQYFERNLFCARVQQITVQHLFTQCICQILFLTYSNVVLSHCSQIFPAAPASNHISAVNSIQITVSKLRFDFIFYDLCFTGQKIWFKSPYKEQRTSISCSYGIGN